MAKQNRSVETIKKFSELGDKERDNIVKNKKCRFSIRALKVCFERKSF